MGNYAAASELMIQTRRSSKSDGVSAMILAMRARYLIALVVGLGLVLAGAIETGIHQRQAHQAPRSQTVHAG